MIDEAMMKKLESGTAEEVELIATAALENARAAQAMAEKAGGDDDALAEISDAVQIAEVALAECQEAIAAGDEAACREAAERVVAAAQEAHEAAERAGVEEESLSPENPGDQEKLGQTEAWAKMYSTGKNPY